MRAYKPTMVPIVDCKFAGSVNIDYFMTLK